MKARKHLLTHVFVSLAAFPVALPPALAANAPALGQPAQFQTHAGLMAPAMTKQAAPAVLVAQAEEPAPELGEDGKPKKKRPEGPAEKAPAEPPKAEPPKAEPPKAEPPKPEPPKPEPPKPEPPKPAPEPKAEAPKPAPEPPKPEPKAPEPKAPEPKAEAPKPEPKAEAPKPEAPKQAAPKAEPPAAEAPKPEKKRPPEPDAGAKPPAEKPAPPAPKPAVEPKPAEKPAAEALKPAPEPKPEAPATVAPKPDAPKAPAGAAPEAKPAPDAEQPAKPAPAGEAPAPAGAVKPAPAEGAPAAVAPAGQQAPVLDSAKPAPVLDSAKPAPGAAPAAQPNAAKPVAPGQPPAPSQPPAAPAPGAAPAAVAPVAPAAPPAPPPKTDADAQAPMRNAAPPPPPPPLAPNAAGWDRGQRMQAPPRYDAPADARVEGRVDGRDVLNILGQIIVRGGDSDRFSRGAEDSYYDQLPGGRTRETIERPNGVMIVTIRNRYGDVIQRSRIGRDGRETVLFYDPGLQQRPDRERVFRDPSLDLPPMQLDIPVDEYIIDTSNARNPDYYDFLREPPVERVERVYSLDEVKYSARIRDKMRRIDLDTIHFATGSADISMNEAGAMKRVAQAMKKIIDKNPGETFLIEGHTDAVGSDQSNLVLSDKRAESVAVTLSELYDIPPENLVTQGYGERFLKVQTSGPSEENRRVTIRRITPLVRPVASK